MWLLQIFLCFFPVQAQDKPLELEKEVRYYIDDILSKNPTSQKRVTLRTGMVQVVGNTRGLKLNSQDSMPILAGEFVWDIKRHFGIEARGSYAQNVLYPAANTSNGSDKHQLTYDLGARYYFELDPSRPGNYFAFKTMYHHIENNFKLIDPSLDVAVNQYTGMLFGIEKGMPVTDNVSVLASVDFIYLLDTVEKSDFAVNKNGFGVNIRGQFDYKVNWFSHPANVGIAYWHSSYSNDFGDEDKRNIGGKNSYKTTSRMLSLSYTLLY